ncbi:7273_t:CDS:2, partial [Ambispora leptoticha]
EIKREQIDQKLQEKLRKDKQELMEKMKREEQEKRERAAKLRKEEEEKRQSELNVGQTKKRISQTFFAPSQNLVSITFLQDCLPQMWKQLLNRNGNHSEEKDREDEESEKSVKREKQNNNTPIVSVDSKPTFTSSSKLESKAESEPMAIEGADKDTSTNNDKSTDETTTVNLSSSKDEPTTIQDNKNDTITNTTTAGETITNDRTKRDEKNDAKKKDNVNDGDVDPPKNEQHPSNEDISMKEGEADEVVEY